MSNVLPRSHKQLHFTGSAKAFAPERPANGVNGANGLGQERPRVPPPPPPSRAVASQAKLPAKKLAPVAKLTTMRGQLASVDDDILTQSLDRHEINAALFPIARRANALEPAPNLPVPHFRSAAEARAQHAEPAIVIAHAQRGVGLPLSVWLIAALIAGIVSYQVTPQAVESVAQAVRALDAR